MSEYFSYFLHSLYFPYVCAGELAVGETRGPIYSAYQALHRGETLRLSLVMMNGCNDTLYTVLIPQLFPCRSFSRGSDLIASYEGREVHSAAV